MSAGPAVQTLTCQACGSDWQRPVVRGTRPRRCPDCRTAGRAATGPAPRRLDPLSPGYRLAQAVTTYRLAIEQATLLLRAGQPRQALTVLDTVAAPTRAGVRRGRVIDLTSPPPAPRKASP